MNRDSFLLTGKDWKRDRRGNYIGEDQGHEKDEGKKKGARRNRKKYEKDKKEGKNKRRSRRRRRRKRRRGGRKWGPGRGLRTRRSEWTSPLGMFFWQSCRCRLLRSPGGVALIFFFRPRLIENSTERFTVFAPGPPFVPPPTPPGTSPTERRIHLREERRVDRRGFRLRLVSSRFPFVPFRWKSFYWGIG